MSEYSTDEINTGVPDLVDRCAVLERKEIAAVNEIQRLLLSRSEARIERDALRARLERAEEALREIGERATPPEWVTKNRKQLLFHVLDIRAAARAALGAAGERGEG